MEEFVCFSYKHPTETWIPKRFWLDLYVSIVELLLVYWTLNLKRFYKEFITLLKITDELVLRLWEPQNL